MRKNRGIDHEETSKGAGFCFARKRETKQSRWTRRRSVFPLFCARFLWRFPPFSARGLASGDEQASALHLTREKESFPAGCLERKAKRPSSEGFFIFFASILFEQLTPSPPPQQQQQQQQQKLQNRPLPPRPAVVLCFGDSLTEGTLGADWVARLGDSLGGSSSFSVRVINCGVSGQLASAVASRVESTVAACSGRVVGVFVLCGTNDVLAACAGRANRKKRRSGGGGGGTKKSSSKKAPSLLSSLFPEAARRSLYGSFVRFAYRATNALPRAPLTRPAALASVAAALDAAALSAPGAALAVATIPPLGEDLSSKTNAAVRDLNRGIRCVASARPRVTLLDVHAALAAALAAKREEVEGDGGRGGNGQLSLIPSSVAATANNSEEGEEGGEESEEEEEDLSLTVGPSCLMSALLRVVFRISWDR